MFENKSLTYFSNLGSYKLKYVLSRVMIITLSAVLLILFVVFFSGKEPPDNKTMLKVYLVAILAFNSVSEINLLVIRYFKKVKKIQGNFYIQSIIVLSITVLLALFWTINFRYILPGNTLLHDKITQFGIVLSFLILLIHLLIIIISNLSKEWLNNQKEIEELKQAKLLSDYNLLKDKLNPHFLFNNLSVLKSLIHYNPEIAEKFTENFTDVYRYVLNSHERKTVTLKEELTFLNSYISLHKERLGNGLEVNINIEKEFLQYELPPLALQQLIENAIKHNITNKLHPLIIEISTREKSLIVKNNLNKKENTYSTKVGLQTLQAQFKMITNENLIIQDDGKFFIVAIPLI